MNFYMGGNRGSLRTRGGYFNNYVTGEREGIV